MRWVAIFDDKPEMIEHRNKHRLDHIAYVRKHKDEILIGGGFREEPEGNYVGGMWVMEVQDRKRATVLIESDPYFNPLYRKYRLLVWGKILEDVNVML